MKRTRKKLNEYWDEVVLKAIPSYIEFRKMEGEIKEHFNFIKWMFKRVVLPLILFYVVSGLFLGMNIFGSLFISMIIFIYSNFLPDIDFLIKKTEDENKDSLWYEKYFLLFFTPVIMYYIIAGRARPLYSIKDRCFHNFNSAMIWGIFLFIIGSIFWFETLNRVMFPIFGMIGFVFHLLVDIKFRNGRHKIIHKI